jgi:phosphohistidine phosphatase SixA
MLVLLLRHGHAEAKRNWRGDDCLRPLNAQGMAEAGALAKLLATYAPQRIVSSPFVRCVQSVRPLGDAVGIPVETSASLVPDASAAAALFVRDVATDEPGAVVMCTHGEIIHDLQERLVVDDPSSFGPQSPREKASVWVLQRRDGRWVTATYLPPPPVGS